MGNQLTGIVPSQILPVEQYLTELPQYQFDVNLGSTRFFKVARARCKEGLIVAKVFVIHDPSLPLKTYKEKLEDIHAQLQAATNCLPFQTLKTEKAALLIRQFVKDSLYDRISTRPFLNLIEKKWIAYQLLCAINQCHKLNVCHGDIKSENVMITSWNWLLLTDFACFKPTYLPEDNPADFSYFFDASRRRTCYIAPERFVESSWRTVDPMKDVSNLDLTASEVKKGDLTPSMDVFSAGCVIAELFTEGTRPFDLSQLLGYRTGDYSPAKLLQNIEDVHIKELVQHMIQKDPLQRHFAERYLAEQRGKAFPEYFYTFLYPYCQRFAQTPIVYSDDRVIRLKRDIDLIVQHLNIASEAESPLVIFISLVTSCIRQLLYSSQKLIALELLYTLSRYVSADIVLDRVIPYIFLTKMSNRLHRSPMSTQVPPFGSVMHTIIMLQLVADQFPAVRCEAIRTITKCLADIKSVPVSDANVFPEYILPIMTPLLHDPVTMVRVTYAENIATLAETALGFLEMVQLNASNQDSSSHDHSQPTSYDSELQALHEMIQTNVVTLLTDPDSIVKQTLLQNGITRLCVFFGRQKANDVLLSHMITFLNDKNDWQLRGAFFDNVVGVVTYVGWQSSVILKPLLQQGLGDAEEFVIVKAIGAMTSIIELGLLQKSDVQELLSEVARFLIHPNVWIRQNTVGFVATVARKVDIADIHCHILPTIASFLKQPVMQVNQEVIILSSLKDPLQRSLYDHVVRMSNLEVLISCLKDRQLVRSVSRPGYEPPYSEVDETVALSLRKLVSQGMTPEEEEKIVALGEFFVKLHKATTVSAVDADIYACDDDDGKPGVINLAAIRRSGICKHVDFSEQELPTNSKLESAASSNSRKTARKKANSPDSPVQFMSEDWKVMFSTSPAEKSAHKPSKQASSMSSSNSLIFDKDQSMQSQLSSAITVSNEHSIHASGTGSVAAVAAGVAVLSSSSTASSGLTVVSSSTGGRSTPRNAASAGGLDASSLKASVAQCKRDVRKLIQKKVEQFSQDRVMADLMEGGGSRCGPDIVKPLPSNWKPKGVMVAHLHEHRGAVNRVRVSPDQVFFATCSNDGTVKLWDCSRIDGKSIANRSRHTYNKQGGQIKTITFCDSSQCIAAASDSGSIHVYRIEAASNRYNILQTKNLDVNTEGLIVDMMYFDNGSQNVIVYTTVHGLIVGWDLRSSKVVWKLQNSLKQGLITSFDIHHQLCWLAVGTSKGAHTCWDMRFQLPISTVVHPTGTCVRRLIVNQTLQSSVISSLQGNNEVSMWDMETSARNRTLWASSAPPLSQTKTSKHCVNGLCVGICDRSQFLLTAGTDMRIRYWDTTFPGNSRIVINAATDPVHSSTAVSYRARLIEGTEVIQETYSSIQPPPKPNDERTMPDRPAVGHHDIITDIAMCTPSQCYIVTSSRDGMVKVWK